MSMALGRRTSTAAASETSMTQGSRYTTAVGRGSSMALCSKAEVLGICEDDKLGSGEAQCRWKPRFTPRELLRRWLQVSIRQGAGWFLVSQLLNQLVASRLVDSRLGSWSWQEVSKLEA